MKQTSGPGAALDNVDMRLIRVFRAVVDCGGMSAAEVDLNIGRSTISRHVKELESRLGCTLCHRGRSGFSLTPEGEHIYAAAQRLLGAVDQFQAEVNDIQANMTGQFSLALFDKTATNPKSHIHDALAAFRERAPDVSINVHVEPVNEIEQGVIDGRYQLGITPTNRASSSLHSVPLFDEQMYLYCGRGHPLHETAGRAQREEILVYDYAGMGFPSPNMDVGRALGLKRSATAFDQEAIVTLIRSDHFVGFLPDHYASAFEQRGQIRRLGGDEFQYRCEFSAVYRRSPKPSRILATFLAVLIDAHPDK